MKKIALSVLSVVCAVCMMFGFMTMANVSNIASADTTVELSATAIKKSVNKDKMLLVTAVKNYETVYEVGYNGIEEDDKITAETDRYYSDITAGTKTWTAETIFGSEFADAGLIVWEIDYDKTQDYTFTAYAKYGTITQEGIEPVGTVDGTERTVGAEKVLTPLPQSAFTILTADSSKGAQQYGYAKSMSVSNGNYVVEAFSGLNAPEFSWNKAAIESLIALGIKTITFDVQLDGVAYLGIYISKAENNYFSTNATVNVINGGLGTFNQVPNGAKVTLDLDAVLTAMVAQSAPIRFVLSNYTNTNKLSENSNVNVTSTITFANVIFGLETK